MDLETRVNETKKTVVDGHVVVKKKKMTTTRKKICCGLHATGLSL